MSQVYNYLRKTEMKPKRDRYGRKITEGAVVLTRITINHDNYRGFSFATTICRKRGRSLILDGVWTECLVRLRKRRDLVVVTPEIDLREVEAEFIRENIKDRERGRA